ncbi:hypothetical protein BGZ65_012217, partial [Modicella reniformis]
MAESAQQVEAVVAPTPVPVEDNPVLPDSLSDTQPAATIDDQEPSLLPPEATKEMEREQGSDSAISLNLTAPSDHHQELAEQEPKAETIQTDSDTQDTNQHVDSVMEETSEFATPEAAPDGVIDPNPTASDTADPYTEQDEAYKDTELVSAVPVPSNEAAAEAKSDQNQTEGEEAAQSQADGQPAKSSPAATSSSSSGKPQSGNNNNNNNNNNRHFQKGGRGGYHNNRNHHNNNNNNNNANFQNNNNNNNHNNNNNNFNNFANNANNNHPNHNNHHGGPGPMRRGGYR